MTRNLKAIGLALLLAALATSALAATGAFAEEEEGAPGTLTAAAYPATLDGTDVAGQTNAFTLFGEEIVCPDSSYTSGQIAAATTAVTITPTYNNAQCSAGGGGHKVTVTMNGCDYQLNIGKTTTKFKDNYYVTIDLLCPPGKDVEIHKYFGMKDEFIQECKYTIKEQKGLKGAKVTNEIDAGGKTTGTFTLETGPENILASKSGTCGAEDTKVGKIDMNITFKGTDKDGKADNIEITDS